jgi:hypothetical protein
MDKSRTESGINFKDESFICCDCGEIFIWSYGEQLYYRDRKLSPPRRCPSCRQARRKRIDPRPAQQTDIDDTFTRAQEEINRWRPIASD